MECDDLDDSMLSAHAFARLHGLARPYDADDPRVACSSFRCMMGNSGNDEAEELPMLATVKNALRQGLTEKLDVVEGVAELLFEIVSGGNGERSFDLVGSDEDHTERPRKNHGMEKLALPLLHTDEEVDFNCVCRLAEVSVTRHVVKRLHINVDADEGLDWSNATLKLPEKLMDDLISERIEVPRSALQVMQSFMIDEWTSDDISAALSEDSQRMAKRRKPNPITPPLSPMIVERTIPDSSTLAVVFQPWSDVTDPNLAILEDIESVQLEQDLLRLDSPVIEDGDQEPGALLASINDMSSSVKHTPKPLVLSNCKVESPLLPVTDTWNGMNNGTAISEQLKAFTDLNNIYWQGQSDEQYGEAFVQMRPFAANADSMTHQEQLSEKDSKLRVDVPYITPLDLMLPWNLYPQPCAVSSALDDTTQAHKRWVLTKQNDRFVNMSIWPGTSALERSMLWKPFSDHAAKHVTEESLDQSDFLGSVLECMTLSDVVTSDAEAWKADGLRILDDDEDDGDELEPALMEYGGDCLEDLLRQKRLEMTDDNTNWHHRVLPVAKVSTGVDEIGTTSQVHEPRGVNVTRRQLELFFSSKGIQLKEDKQLDASTTMDPRLAGRKSQNLAHSVQPVESPSSLPKPLLLPPMPHRLESRCFIISSELRQRRRALCQQIEDMYPTAKLTERDWSSMQRVYTQADTKLMSCSEADIILSPSTALIMTTLQKIQQITLPGAGPQRNTFHDRITSIAVRYEKLIILVCQTSIEATPSLLTQVHTSSNAPTIMIAPPITTSDVKAIASLNALATRLPANITVQMILGGEREVAGWCVFYMANIKGQPYTLPQDESFWEQTLRRAGMNAFAACVVLARLGRECPIDYETREDHSGGLARFLAMHPDERVRMFADDFGGENVLCGVSACLDREWISASRGFQK